MLEQVKVIGLIALGWKDARGAAKTAFSGHTVISSGYDETLIESLVQGVDLRLVKLALIEIILGHRDPESLAQQVLGGSYVYSSSKLGDLLAANLGVKID